MIWFKLFLMILAVAYVDSGPAHQSYIVYVSENSNTNTIDFFIMDLNKESAEKFLTFEGDKSKVSSIFISPNKTFLYWNFDGSTSVYQYDFSNRKLKMKKLGEDETGTFVGLGNNDQIYFYSPQTKTLKVYDYNTQEVKFEFKGFKDVDTDMQCVDVDPRGRKRLFFTECSCKQCSGKIFDIDKQEILLAYNQNLPKCFDTWRITPNAKRTYAVGGNRIYVSVGEKGSFFEYHKAESKILAFAAGNNEFFYTTKNGRKLVKMMGPPNNDGLFKNVKEYNINGTVNKIALHQHWQPEEFLFILSDIIIDFIMNLYKADFNLNNLEDRFTFFPGAIDNMFFGSTLNGEVLYWNYKGDKRIGYHVMTPKNTFYRYINKGEEVFVGPGVDNQLYFYNPKSKSIAVYDIKTLKKVKSLAGLECTSGDVHFLAKDPCKKELLYFAECTGTKNTLKVYDIEQERFLNSYNKPMRMCFDYWRITPNGKIIFGVKGNQIYESRDGDPFSDYYTVEGDIVAITAGNEEIFYATKEKGKIFKLTKASEDAKVEKTELKFDKGPVHALTAYQNVFSESC